LRIAIDTSQFERATLAYYLRICSQKRKSGGSRIFAIDDDVLA
jgi:hypothetical protein